MALAALAHVPRGEWDEALAVQARLRELLDGGAPPSFATGGYGAEMFIHEAREDRAAADAVLAEVDAWTADPQRRRPWPAPLIAAALARRGDVAAARARLATLDQPIYRQRALEVRCSVLAEEGTWDEAGAVADEARRLARAARLRTLALHADRLEGRARAAGGEPEGAVAPLERARAGFARAGAAWEVAVTELALGEAFAQLGRADPAAHALTRAAETFERLRVPRERERAEAALGRLASPR
jgi:hypothetical protein